MFALFVALGGSSYAAVLITSAKIKNHTIRGVDVQNNTLGGTQINESKLGTVRSATNATNATHAGTADNATHAGTADNATHAGTADNATNATNATTATNATQLGGVAAAGFVHGIHLVTAASPADSATKTIAAVCPGNEVALGGGGNNDAPTGTVTFDRVQLASNSFTVTEFEVNGGTASNWTAFAEVTCGIPGT